MAIKEEAFALTTDIAERSKLIIVSGAPGTGKTALARLLAGRLDWPLISRDDLKEAMLDAMGAPDRASSREIGAASFAVLYRVLSRLTESGVNVIAETNFSRGISEPELLPLLKRSRAIQVHCRTSTEKIERRILRRFSSTDRHRGHRDLDALPEVLTKVAAGVYEPLDLGVPLFVVDTSDEYIPNLDEISSFLL